MGKASLSRRIQGMRGRVLSKNSSLPQNSRNTQVLSVMELCSGTKLIKSWSSLFGTYMRGLWGRPMEESHHTERLEPSSSWTYHSVRFVDTSSVPPLFSSSYLSESFWKTYGWRTDKMWLGWPPSGALLSEQIRCAWHIQLLRDYDTHYVTSASKLYI
jgi:hypothetical protein